jgi:hypothetical protein
MRDRARADEDDESSWRDLESDLAWSGVHSFALRDLIGKTGSDYARNERARVLRDLREQGYAYLETA